MYQYSYLVELVEVLLSQFECGVANPFTCTIYGVGEGKVREEGDGGESESERGDEVERGESDKSEEEDICPICLNELDEGEDLITCRRCGNQLHQHCMDICEDIE